MVNQEIKFDVAALNGFEKYSYKKINEQIKDAPSISWGNGLNMLIFSDRGFGRAYALYEFVIRKTGFSNVKLVQTLESAEEYVNIIAPDIIVFAAMQEQQRNYRIIDTILRFNPHVFSTMYASHDEIVERECKYNHICCIGDCWKPISQFFELLEENYNKIMMERLQMRGTFFER